MLATNKCAQWILCLVSLPVAQRVSAQSAPVTVAPIDVHARAQPEDSAAHRRERGLNEAAFATVVNVDETRGETTSLAEVLSESTGVRVRSLGGLGAFSAISVRGGSPGHTAILVDGIAVSSLGSAAHDLGQYDLTSFSQLELFRGGVPARFGGAAMAGALNLVTKVGPDVYGRRLKLSLGGGSFGARHVRARYLAGTDADNGAHFAASYAGAEGDFRYFNDNGTNLNTADDHFVRRRNNGYDQVDVVWRQRRKQSRSRFEFGVRAHGKRQGVAGTASRQSNSSSLTTTEAIADARFERANPWGLSAGTANVLGYVSVQRQAYRDVEGEIGIAAQDRRYDTVSAGAQFEVRSAVGENHLVAAAVSSRAEVFAETDHVLDARRSLGGRVGVGFTITDDWERDRWLVQPAIRLDVLRTTPIRDADSPVVGPMDLATRTEVHPSPRIASRWRVLDSLAVKASAGWYFRAPTATELFGDRGYFVGNPGLRAETGLVGDVGAVLAPSRAMGPFDRLFVETVMFASRPRDSIVPVPTAGLVTVAQNLGHAAVFGVEMTASVRAYRKVTLSLNYTRLQSKQESPLPSYDGKALPQRPTHDVYGRVDVVFQPVRRTLTLWADARFTGGNYLDPANIRRVPGRRLFGAGVTWQPWTHWSLGVEGKNLADERVERVGLRPAPRPDLTSVPQAITEFAGYPLPGRAFYLSIEWNH